MFVNKSIGSIPIFDNDATTSGIVIQSNLAIRTSFRPKIVLQLTHNMTTDCSLYHQFSTWKFQAQNILCTQIVFLFRHSEQFMYTTCSEHVLSLEFSCIELVIQWTICCHIAHCLGMNYYVNFWEGIGSNGFHLKLMFVTQDNWKD